ncbi:activating signal cointegrator 1 complex subunit 2 [Battus philenor]|uniref:activating signal cointegrator 1 complex subunit 2 n=1 Tax=Battus philenor TaxID=42288 RepID=UPI0035D0CD6F
MNNKNIEFINPENLPVENVTLTVSNVGIVQKIKALDPYWVEKRGFPVYERPPSGSTMVLGAVDAWKMKMDVYLEDLKLLLALPHHRFWSTILYHPNCMDSLISFLQEASPPYLPPHESKVVQSLYGDIRRLILIIFSRLITNKESKLCWMSKDYMATLIYDRFVFTVPVIWDICLVYGVDNAPHVSRLLQGVFKLQPQYETDAAAAVTFVKEAFKFIILQVNKDYDSDEPPNLPETFKGFGDIRRPSNSKAQDSLTFDSLRDIIIHLLDTAITLRIFIETYPKAVDIYKKTNLILSVVQIYEYGIPKIYEKLEEVGDQKSIAYTEVEGYIDLARAELIDILREILAVHKNGIFSGEGSIASHVEDFLAVMMDALAEKLLIRDYHLCYPINEDLEMLRQAYPEIDSVKTDFILQAIYSNLDEPIPEDVLTNASAMMNGDVVTTDNIQPTSIDNEIPDDVKEESLISEVKDILPHLGDGFILKCLKHYGFNTERVINSLLEGTLAEPLKGIDQSLPIIPEDPVDRKYLETGIQRLNVFDGDQFDIMSRDDVDVSKIHVGKRRGKYKDLKDMLDDKTEVKTRVDIYNKYNLVCDDVAMYSDEYDDTYDSDGVAPRNDTADDPRRPFVTPRVLATRIESEESDGEEEPAQNDKNESSAGTSRNRMDFCMNPEEIRARREANYHARRGRGFQHPPPRNTDVTGKPRGQGQEKEVLANRDKKEKHKSSRANHNRRQGAQWKRSQGMMPS